MKRSLLLIVSILILVGAAFGAYRFFAGRTETRSFEPRDKAPTSEAVPESVTEDLTAENEAADEPESTALNSEPEEQNIISTARDTIPVESEPEAEKDPEPEAQPVPAPSITDRLVSFGHENRSSRSIDTIIIHSSYDALGDNPYSVSGIMDIYRQYGVAAHYLIDRGGTIYRLVEDRDVAYHAGVSRMPDGRTGVNAFSLGIEIVSKDTESPNDIQYEILNLLLEYLKQRYPIKYILGHDDIAPDRKTDPWNFDWDRVVESP